MPLVILILIIFNLFNYAFRLPTLILWNVTTFLYYELKISVNTSHSVVLSMPVPAITTRILGNHKRLLVKNPAVLWTEI